MKDNDNSLSQYKLLALSVDFFEILNVATISCATSPDLCTGIIDDNAFVYYETFKRDPENKVRVKS